MSISRRGDDARRAGTKVAPDGEVWREDQQVHHMDQVQETLRRDLRPFADTRPVNTTYFNILMNAKLTTIQFKTQ